jgi:hypothetical protein
MTNRHDAISTLAIMLLDSATSDLADRDPRIADLDHLALMRAIQPILTASDFTDLCFATDLCPMHLIDIEICADDANPDCAAIRES